MRRVLGSAVVAMLVVAALCGCVDRTPFDLTGTWLYADDAGHRSELTIEPDGTFTIDLIPRIVLDPAGAESASADYVVDLDWGTATSASGEILKIDDKVNYLNAQLSPERSVAQVIHVSDDGTFIALVSGNPDNSLWFRFYRQ